MEYRPPQTRHLDGTQVGGFVGVDFERFASVPEKALQVDGQDGVAHVAVLNDDHGAEVRAQECAVLQDAPVLFFQLLAQLRHSVDTRSLPRIRIRNRAHT